ncbi:hypothetical protein FJTKL_12314 [Diaporthe vaccinii]|uniref:Uncharacterized protein n=1 Tax=Diaporthe vaccinii TaxID=105482 RepID=A0ABR4EES9_9PEZI
MSSLPLVFVRRSSWYTTQDPSSLPLSCNAARPEGSTCWLLWLCNIFLPWSNPWDDFLGPPLPIARPRLRGT